MEHSDTNCGPGMVYDTPDEKEIERQKAIVVKMRQLNSKVIAERDEWRGLYEHGLEDRNTLLAENVRLKNFLGFDQTWTLFDLLNKLRQATNHLLDVHGCDTHGHEEYREASRIAEKRLKGLEGSPASGGAES
jgi:hypothetical protein